MNYFALTDQQQEWKERTATIAERDIGPRAADYDYNREFPQESLNALRDAGLWSMRVPQKYGGLGLDLVTTCLIVEEISKKCPSTAMCYKMHLEAVEAISHIPTEYQLKRYIEPLLRGEVFAAAPGGEPHVIQVMTGHRYLKWLRRCLKWMAASSLTTFVSRT